MYAIVEDSGTQIKLAPGAVLDVDLREDASEGSTITFDRVLAVKGEGDETATLGTPYIDGASVTAEVLGEIKGEKLDVIKFKRRKNYRRKQGHRQRYLRIRVADIAAKPKKKTTKKKAAEPAASSED
ncbi:MAG: 50S ribosomal protein L21 [Phycisphaerales bacterium]|nr:50S ribosomal protein L21 [Phycisphaerales bacterium]